MATRQNFVTPLPLTQPTACRLFDPPYPPKTDSFARDPLRNHRHLAIAPVRSGLLSKCLTGMRSIEKLADYCFFRNVDSNEYAQTQSQAVSRQNRPCQSGG